MDENFQKIALARHGQIDPASIEDFLDSGGFESLKKALALKPEEIVESIEKSGLRGRGGAGFSTGLKQKYTAKAYSDNKRKFVVCNADEGEPGTFKDRVIMESDPFLLIEGIIISAYAISADYGYVYLRGEFYQSIENIKNAIELCYKKGYLGKDILGSGFSFDLEIALGAGSYLCGEELTLLESLEGNRGYPRIKPPFPAEKGLWGKPTLINNVETFTHIPFIIEKGYEEYANIGTEESKGTKIFCVSGNVINPGVYELPMGVLLKELIYDVAGGIKDGYSFKGALLGGAAGSFVDRSFLDVPLAYETLKQKGSTLGSGAVIVIDDKTDMKALLSSVLSFFKHESCGKCVPCRIGTTLLYDMINNVSVTEKDLLRMQDEASYMAKSSLCPLGQSPDLPLKTFVQYFKNSL